MGHKVGETVGEFTEGVTKGAQKAFDIVIKPSEDLKKRGISVGKVLYGSDTATNGDDNKLSVYIIFAKDFDADVIVKVSDAKGLEMGRAKTRVKGVPGDAAYFDFIFDKRTNIESDSKITIE